MVSSDESAPRGRYVRVKTASDQHEAPGWVLMLLACVAVILLTLAAATAWQATYLSALPRTTAPVTGFESGRCGKSGPCDRGTVLLPGAGNAVSVSGGPTSKTGDGDELLGRVVDFSYDSSRAWATSERWFAAVTSVLLAAIGGLAAAATVSTYRARRRRTRPRSTTCR